jgi:hypothetical protein
MFIEKTVPILVDNHYIYEKVGNQFELKETIFKLSFNAGFSLTSVARCCPSSRN